MAIRYVLLDPELDNFTYRIANVDELAEVLARAIGIDASQMRAHIHEAETDPRLYSGLPFRPLSHKRRQHYGRRLGWYALIRAAKPALVVETGTHDGLGAVALLAALARNAGEGAEGELLSVDTNPAAGWLVPEPLRSRWKSVVGSSFDVLPRALEGRKVGMIMHDSDHSYGCEYFELSTALDHAAETIVLATDNGHATSALSDIASEQGVAFHLFRERPLSHFYPGAGLGVAVVRRG